MVDNIESSSKSESKGYRSMNFSMTRSRRNNSHHPYAPQSIESKIHQLKLKKYECSVFIATGKPDDNGISLCGCGRPESLHTNETIDKSKNLLNSGSLQDLKWNCEQHTKEIDSYDFGNVNFSDTKGYLSKFARVSPNTTNDQLTSLLFSCWKLKRPELLISITGGAKKYDLNMNLKNLLRAGLVKTALSTNAWIITGGTNEGIMKDVGEAVRENVSALDPTKEIILLGIANWTTIRNSYLLEKKFFDEQQEKNIANDLKPNKNFEYSKITNNSNEEQRLKTKHSPLDPNHSHFLLVDNQKLNVFGGEIELRSRLESAISNYQYKRSKKDKIPIIVLVVGGGPNTFGMVKESVEEGSPCIFIENSGRCANVFVHIYKILKGKISLESDQLYTMSNSEGSSNTSPSFRNEILSQLEINIPEKKSEHADLADIVEKVFEYTHLLTIFSLDSTEHYHSNTEVDEAILYSILKAKQNRDHKAEQSKSLVQTQLQLALVWNRIDMANKYLLADHTWESRFFDKLMYTAINLNRVDFVHAFLRHGLVLSKFLTNRRLLKLYNDIPKNNVFYSLLLRNKRIKEASIGAYIRRIKYNNQLKNNSDQICFSFKDIGKVFEKLLDNFYRHHFQSFPFRFIPNRKNRIILQQTDEFGKCNRLTSTLYLDIETINFEAPVPNPENELVMYSIATNKPEMAKLFIKEGRTEISSLLVASKIFKSYSERYDQDSDEFTALASNFENLACEMIDQAFETDNRKARLLLMREVPEFGNSTCLQLANLAHDQKFLGHKCVQDLLIRLWFNRLHIDNSNLNIAISLCIPFLGPVLLQYRELRAEINQDDQDSTKMVENIEDQPIMYNNIVNNDRGVNNVKIKNRINFNPYHKRLNYFEKLYHFLSAPIVKFAYDKISFILFLILFSYVLLCDFHPFNDKFHETTTHGTLISLTELFLIIWAASFMVQKLNSFYTTESNRIQSKIKLFFYNRWNTIEVLASVLFIIGIIFRFIPNNSNCYLASRIILSIDIIIWFFKSLHLYTVIKELGPKLVMINRMSIELSQFMFILLIFMFAFGVSTQALMYHNLPLDWELLKHVFFPAYFIIGGEYYTADILLESNKCVVNDTTRSQTDIYTQTDCPEKNGAGVALFLYTFYLIFMNILLINLLIAIFSKTYDSIEEESDNIWKTQRYQVIYEYFHKPTLPPPLVMLTYLTYPITFFCRIIKMVCLQDLVPSDNVFNKIFFHFYQQYSNGFKIYFENDNQRKAFIIWESQIAEECVNNEKKELEENIEYKMHQNLKKLNKLNREINMNVVKRLQTVKDLDKIDKVLEKIIEKIKANPSSNDKKHISEIVKNTLKAHLEN